MKRTKISMSASDYNRLLEFVKTGKKGGKELERAYILLALHDQRPYADIERYYHVGRTTIWRIAESIKEEVLRKPCTINFEPVSRQNIESGRKLRWLQRLVVIAPMAEKDGR